MNELLTMNGNGHGGALAVMPAMDIKSAMMRYQMVVSFVREIMVKGIDYGAVPGTDKDVLLKPGAERLCSFFALAPEFHTVERTEDWTGEDHDGEPFIYYRFKCKLHQSGRFVGEGEGSCNTRESKYRWRWVKESDLPPGLDTTGLVKRSGSMTEFAFAVEKAETGGQYGKPPEYWQRFQDAIEDGTARRLNRKSSKGKELDAWQIDTTVYRIPNDDIASQANTVLKMAQKRALIAATLVVVNASEFFTQDMEDLVSPDSEIIEATYTPRGAAASPPAANGNGNAGASTPANGNGQQQAAKPAEYPPAPKNWTPEIEAATDAQAVYNIIGWIKAMEAEPHHRVGAQAKCYIRLAQLATSQADLEAIAKVVNKAPLPDERKEVIRAAIVERAGELTGGDFTPGPDSSGLEAMMQAEMVDAATGEVIG